MDDPDLVDFVVSVEVLLQLVEELDLVFLVFVVRVDVRLRLV